MTNKYEGACSVCKAPLLPGQGHVRRMFVGGWRRLRWVAFCAAHYEPTQAEKTQRAHAQAMARSQEAWDRTFGRKA